MLKSLCKVCEIGTLFFLNIWFLGCKTLHWGSWVSYAALQRCCSSEYYANNSMYSVIQSCNYHYCTFCLQGNSFETLSSIVPALNDSILRHNAELTNYIQQLSAEKQELRTALSSLQTQTDNKQEKQVTILWLNMVKSSHADCIVILLCYVCFFSMQILYKLHWYFKYFSRTCVNLSRRISHKLNWSYIKTLLKLTYSITRRWKVQSINL